MSNARKLKDLKEAHTCIETLERLGDLYAEVPTVSDAEVLELAAAIQDLESRNTSRCKTFNQWN
jgi:hypothetical protein